MNSNDTVYYIEADSNDDPIQILVVIEREDGSKIMMTQEKFENTYGPVEDYLG